MPQAAAEAIDAVTPTTLLSEAFRASQKSSTQLMKQVCPLMFLAVFFLECQASSLFRNNTPVITCAISGEESLGHHEFLLSLD
jgi:hypothetical protein